MKFKVKIQEFAIREYNSMESICLEAVNFDFLKVEWQLK